MPPPTEPERATTARDWILRTPQRTQEHAGAPSPATELPNQIGGSHNSGSRHQARERTGARGRTANGHQGRNGAAPEKIPRSTRKHDRLSESRIGARHVPERAAEMQERRGWGRFYTRAHIDQTAVPRGSRPGGWGDSAPAHRPSGQGAPSGRPPRVLPPRRTRSRRDRTGDVRG